MEQIKVRLKKWGNSFGVVIPKEIVDREGLKEDNEILVYVKPKKYTTVGDLMKLSKKFKFKKKSIKSTQEIMNEIDSEFWPEDE